MRFLKIGALIGCATVLWGCPPRVEYPIEPIIEFHDFYTDASDPLIGYLSISFTDGDGDIGLTSDMLDSPFDEGSRYHHNMFAEYWEWDGSQWIQPVDVNNEPIEFKWRVPYITPEGKNKALKGTIQVKIEPFFKDPASDNDSIKYRIQLVDRALNTSTWIESPVIYNGVVLQ